MSEAIVSDPVVLLGRRVLVVEDDLMIAMLVEDMLTDLGCAVVGPANGLTQGQALADAEAKLDAALLDVNLGQDTVFPLADQLRARGVPLIFSTGYGDGALREADRVFPILRKPYRASDVAAALRSAIAGS
jgi:CheY-like chemotaxis protein